MAISTFYQAKTTEYKHDKNRHLRNQSKMTVFCFVSEHHLDGEAAAKEIGVRLSNVWWAIKDSNLGPSGYEPDALTN